MKAKIKKNDKIILIDFYTNRIDEKDVKQSFPLTLNHFSISKGLFISDGYHLDKKEWEGIASHVT